MGRAISVDTAYLSSRNYAALFRRRDDVAAMAQHLKVGQVVGAGNATVCAAQRQDVVNLQAKLVTRIRLPRLGVLPDAAGLETAALARPHSAPPGGPPRICPDV